MSSRPTPGERDAAARALAIGVVIGLGLWAIAGAIAYLVYVLTA